MTASDQPGTDHASAYPHPVWVGEVVPPAGPTITITHTHLDGTLLDGSSKGDGVFEIVRRYNFRWMPSIRMIGIRGSRDRRPQQHNIDAAAAALREAGFQVQVELSYEARPAEQVEADRADQNEARIAALEDKAARKIDAGDAVLVQVRQVRDQIPLGQPNIVDSRGRSPLRNLRDKLHRREDRAYEIRDAGVAAAGRAEAAEANQSHHLSGPATERRIQKWEAEERQLTGILEHATGEYQQRMAARLDEVQDRLAWDRRHLEQLNADGKHRTWTAADFAKGDYACCSGRWMQVVKVNAKSLTIPHWCGSGTDSSPYDKVFGRRSASEHLALLVGAAQAENNGDLAGLEPVVLSVDEYASNRSRGWAGATEVFEEDTRGLWPTGHWVLIGNVFDRMFLRPATVAAAPEEEPRLDVVELTADEYRVKVRHGYVGKLGPVLSEVDAMWVRRGATHLLQRGGTLQPALVRRGNTP